MVIASQSLKVIETGIPGVLLLEPAVFEDDRGFFFESYNKRNLEEIGIHANFVQDNHSYSRRNVVRGMHYQVNSKQGKLVRVITGEIFDVVVDLRRSSTAFGKWLGTSLSDENKQIMWIPSGCAHGFQVVSEDAHVLYKVTDFYAPELERTIAWDDPDLAIDWKLNGEPVLSQKDRQGKPFKEAELFV